ncbi:hypothetical protein Q9292_09805 [Methylophilus sp. VKM B-3414]|uniref:hypothetical protein n=1 Tax=Methylophilus sp. VKM B-3414 TaxID=3076121 RepID=UPI0028C68553|nr:hypothetical protein [Methylophilus sp. VKM B-3414]MDT7849905.1 hypothetical protein [Methylophilus sp. VKM B-3414]
MTALVTSNDLGLRIAKILNIPADNLVSVSVELNAGEMAKIVTAHAVTPEHADELVNELRQFNLVNQVE